MSEVPLQSPMVVLGRRPVSYERGTPVGYLHQSRVADEHEGAPPERGEECSRVPTELEYLYLTECMY